MEYAIKLTEPYLLYFLFPCVFFAALFVFFLKKNVFYRYPLTAVLNTYYHANVTYRKKILSLLRLITLMICAFLIARPNLGNYRSNISVEGIDIMLVLDVSGSMHIVDFQEDPRSRLEIAKDEAIRFVGKRENDAIGVVIFGKDVVSRCPLTLDKNMLRDIIKKLHIGIVDHEGTFLATAIITAANRLKQSTAHSKVIILLTDGDSSPGDADARIAVEIAKKMGIKIYTIGIGKDPRTVSPYEAFFNGSGVNEELLRAIAHETGGQFFLASNSKEMRKIYDTIDSLEKTKHDAVIFNKVYDFCVPLLLTVLGSITIEFILAFVVWFGL